MINIVCNVIVIRTIQCSGNKHIVKCYSREYGIQSFVVYLKTQGLNRSLFQPLMQIEIECIQKNKNTLSQIKQVEPKQIYHHIYRDIRKQTIVTFLSEILNTCLQEKEQNQSLYNFISKKIHLLDSITHQEKFEIFHLVFIAELTKFFGFYPNIERYTELVYFDMQAGHCVQKKPFHKFYLMNNFLILLARFLNQNINDIDIFTIQEQRYLTKIMIQYYQLHIDNFVKPKSTRILQDVLW